MSTTTAPLTLDDLQAFDPHSIFASGFGTIKHPWFNDAVATLEKDGRSTTVRWVAVRGGIDDWAIYHSLDANFIAADYLDDPAHLDVPDELIARSGSKVRDERTIRAFVPCTDEALRRYRQ